jgi:2-keto-3-deoxy-L-rhamnonate aldolase RhmA
VAQIEDAEALGNLDAIASVEGLDCLFIGRMDLTVSLGAASPLDRVVIDAVEQICAAGQRHGKTVGMFFPPTEDCARWQKVGATFFMLASDQQFILDGARTLAGKLAPPT